jgi:hypothetical protein
MTTYSVLSASKYDQSLKIFAQFDLPMLNFILIRHQLGEEIITRNPVEPPRRQSECVRKDRELPYRYKVGLGANLADMIVCTPFVWLLLS